MRNDCKGQLHAVAAMQSCTAPRSGRAMYKTAVCSSTAVRKGLHTPEVAHTGLQRATISPLGKQSRLSCWNQINDLLCDMDQCVPCEAIGCSSRTCRRCVVAGIDGCQVLAHMQVPRPSARSHRSTSMTSTSSPLAEAAQACELRATRLAWVSRRPCRAVCKQNHSAHLSLYTPGPCCAFHGAALSVRDRCFLQQGSRTLGCP